MFIAPKIIAQGPTVIEFLINFKENPKSVLITPGLANQYGTAYGGMLASLPVITAVHQFGNDHLPVSVSIEFKRTGHVGETLYWTPPSPEKTRFSSYSVDILNKEDKVVCSGKIDMVKGIPRKGSVDFPFFPVSYNPFHTGGRPNGELGAAHFDSFGGMSAFCKGFLGMCYENVSQGVLHGHFHEKDHFKWANGPVHPAWLVAALDSIAGDCTLSYFGAHQLKWAPTAKLTVNLSVLMTDVAVNDLEFYGWLDEYFQDTDGGVHLCRTTGGIRAKWGPVIATASLWHKLVPQDSVQLIKPQEELPDRDRLRKTFHKYQLSDTALQRERLAHSLPSFPGAHLRLDASISECPH